jgi:hypothetical protein
MNKKDVAIILGPVFVFLIIGISALLGAHLCYRSIQEGDGHQKYETFVQNVQSGNWQITTDRWLKIMREHQATRAAYLEYEKSLRDFMLIFAWIALLGIISHFYTISHIRKRLTKP